MRHRRTPVLPLEAPMSDRHQLIAATLLLALADIAAQLRLDGVRH